MNKNIKLLLSGQLVSQVGDKFHMIALAFWVLETTGSSVKMGTVLAASLIPSLIFGLFSGAIIDRVSKKKIIVGADIIRGGILLAFAWLTAAGQMNFYLILVLQVLLSMNTAFFDPSIPALIPQLVDKEELSRANAMNQAVASISLIGGAALGGVAVAALGYGMIFFINGVSFLVSAGFESCIRLTEVKNAAPGKSIVDDIIKGYLYFLKSPILMAVLLMVMVIHFFVGGIEVIMPMMANEISSQGPAVLGIFQACLGAGTLVMAGVMSRIKRGERQRSVLFLSVGLMGGIQALAGVIPYSSLGSSPGSLPWAVVVYGGCFFLWGSSLVRAAVAFKTLLQTLTEQGFQGRVFALANTLGNASVPAAMVVFGLLLETVAFGKLFLVSGLMLVGLGLMGYYIFREERE